jgi:hypothetical protein
MYTTLTYYRSTYLGQAVADDTKLTQLLTRASDDMDIATLGRIDTTEMGAKELDWLAKATCAQAESYAQNGITETATGASVSLGSFSESGNSGSNTAGAVCSRASRYLMMTGLLNRSMASFPVRNVQELDNGGVMPETNTSAEPI